VQQLRILQLCNKPPLPAIDGGCIAMLNMAEGLMASGCTVKILAIATDKHPWKPEKISREFLKQTSLDAVYIDTTVKRLPAFLSLFKSSSYNVERFYSLAFEARLVEILARNEFDIIQLESLYVTPYISAIRRMSKAKIILRAHNTESDIWKKNAEEEKDLFKRTWFQDLATKLEKHERNALNLVDVIVPITTQDEERLKYLAGPGKNFHTSTFAMRSSPVPQHGTVQEKTVFHIGAMDWKPNSDGINWLMEKVWPLVLNQVPEAELHLAGKGMDTTQPPAVPNVFLHGEVESAAAFMAQYKVMAVPLHSGGGIKVKVVEGMFAGKPIVTTPVGAEGIAFTQGVDLHVVSAPGEFAEKLIALLKDDTLARESGMNAQKTAAEHHELIRVTEKLCDFYRTILTQ